MAKLKAVYYVNQFFAGIGGEDKVDVGLTVHSEKTGPALGIEAFGRVSWRLFRSYLAGTTSSITTRTSGRSCLKSAASWRDSSRMSSSPGQPLTRTLRRSLRQAVPVCQPGTGHPKRYSNVPREPAVPMFVRDVCIVKQERPRPVCDRPFLSWRGLP